MSGWAVLCLEPLNISRLEESRAGRGKQRFLGGLHGVSRVVWRRVARLCSLSHNILIIRALYCANPCVFPLYLRKWADTQHLACAQWVVLPSPVSVRHCLSYTKV